MTKRFPARLQKLSFERGAQLNELQDIIGEITQEIMWVNDKEEEELMFNWGNKNIDVYIPKKQESYSVSSYALVMYILSYTCWDDDHDHSICSHL